jgi:uncharacterized membrane protein
MQHFEYAIHIKAPVDHVWASYVDTSQWRDWMPRAEALEFDGPVDKVGTTYVGTMRILGHEFKSTYEVLEVVPREFYHEHGDMASMDNRMRFQPDGDGTLLTVEIDYEMPGHLPKVIQNLMTRSYLERQTHQMLDDFKAIAEATVPVAV